MVDTGSGRKPSATLRSWLLGRALIPFLRAPYSQPHLNQLSSRSQPPNNITLRGRVSSYEFGGGDINIQSVTDNFYPFSFLLPLFLFLRLNVTEISVYGFILFLYFTYSFNDIIYGHNFNYHTQTSDSYFYIFSPEPCFNLNFQIFSEKSKQMIWHHLKFPVFWIELDISLYAQMALLICHQFICLETIFVSFFSLKKEQELSQSFQRNGNCTFPYSVH